MLIYRAVKKICLCLRRKKNNRQAYIYPESNDGWTKLGFPVVGSAEKGVYFDPCVRKHGSKFIMYVSYRDKNSIVRLESADGIEWENEKTVLEGSADSSWEEIVNRACVIEKDGQYMMWYTGQKNGTSAIGAACSRDGVTYIKYEKNPVLRPVEVYEGAAVMNPCVCYDCCSGKYKMWYSAGENYEPDVLCYAESRDGIHWNRYKENPVLLPGREKYDCYKVGACDVIQTADNSYLMFYIGYQNIDTARICAAVSKDGVTGWHRIERNPVLSPTFKAWDAHALYKPAVFVENGKWYLWYNGRKGRREYIGLARKLERAGE